MTRGSLGASKTSYFTPAGKALVQHSTSNHLLWIARHFGDPIYVPLTESDLATLDEVTSLVSFGSGARLYREGEAADACFLIRSGEVRLQRDGSRPHINLAVLGFGQMTGDYAMLRDINHHSTAVARTDVSAVKFGRPETMEALLANPRVGFRWLSEALGRLESIHGRLDVLLRRSVSARVAAYLLSYGPNGDPVDITHAALAEMIGVERASVSRALAELKRQGLVANSRGTIRILDRERLVEVRDQ